MVIRSEDELFDVIGKTIALEAIKKVASLTDNEWTQIGSASPNETREELRAWFRCEKARSELVDLALRREYDVLRTSVADYLKAAIMGPSSLNAVVRRPNT